MIGSLTGHLPPGAGKKLAGDGASSGEGEKSQRAGISFRASYD